MFQDYFNFEEKNKYIKSHSDNNISISFNQLYVKENSDKKFTALVSLIKSAD